MTTLESASAATPAADLDDSGWGTRLSQAALPLLIALAAANFLWQLGSSSYYVDEIQALDVALSPLRSLWHATAVYEISPPTYFVFLHEWIGRAGSSAEWVTRLPSAMAGVALVGAVYWLGVLLSGRRSVAVAAGGLTALSPYVLEYAQLSQEYVFVMLASALAVATSIEADRAQTPRRRTWWLVGSGAAAVLALWLHYTAGLLVVALCVWVLRRRTLSPRARAGFVATCAIAGVALIPMLIDQHRYHPHRTGVEFTANVTATNIQRVFATPLDGRVDWLLPAATVVTVLSLLWLLTAGRTRVREWTLVAWMAAGVPLTLLVISVFGGHLMLTRYAAVGAPFMIVTIATVALTAVPRIPGAAVGATALVLAIGGLVASHQPAGFYLDARGVARYVRAHEQQGDVVLASEGAGSAVPLSYYGLRLQYFNTPAAQAAYHQRRRVWTIYAGSSNVTQVAIGRYLSFLSAQLGYSVRLVKVFPGMQRLAVALEVPLRRPSSR